MNTKQQPFELNWSVWHLVFVCDAIDYYREKCLSISTSKEVQKVALKDLKEEWKKRIKVGGQDE